MLRKLTWDVGIVFFTSMFVDYWSKDIRDGNFDINRDGFDLQDGMYLLLCLGVIASNTYYAIKSTKSMSKNLCTLWNSKAKQEQRDYLDKLIQMFEDLSQENKEHLWEKKLANKDDKGVISLRFIDPITSLLMADPVYFATFPDAETRRLAEFSETKPSKSELHARIKAEYQGKVRYEIFDFDSFTAWQEQRMEEGLPDSYRSLLQQRHIMTTEPTHCSVLTAEYNKYIKELGAELQSLVIKNSDECEQKLKLQ